MKNDKRILEFLKQNNAPEDLVSTLESEIQEAKRNKYEWKWIGILSVVVFIIGLLARL
jgi:glycerol-3-phosphate responsive antiterminator